MADLAEGAISDSGTLPSRGPRTCTKRPSGRMGVVDLAGSAVVGAGVLKEKVEADEAQNRPTTPVASALTTIQEIAREINREQVAKNAILGCLDRCLGSVGVGSEAVDSSMMTTKTTSSAADSEAWAAETRSAEEFSR